MWCMIRGACVIGGMPCSQGRHKEKQNQKHFLRHKNEIVVKTRPREDQSGVVGSDGKGWSGQMLKLCVCGRPVRDPESQMGNHTQDRARCGSGTA